MVQTSIPGALSRMALELLPVQSGSNQDPEALLVVAGLAFLAGLVLIYFGFKSYRLGRLIRDTPTAKVRSMPIGRVELQGVARDAGETLDPPFSDEESLYVHYEIEEYQYDRHDDEWEWNTVESGTESVPFYLEDDTGSALVDVEDGADFPLSGATRTRFKADGRGDTPEPVAAYLREGSSAGFSDNDRRYTQEVLPVDSDVYVFGGATERADAGGSNEERLVIKTDDMTDRFLVSDRDADELASAYGKRAPLMMVLGLALSTGSLYGLLRVLEML